MSLVRRLLLLCLLGWIGLPPDLEAQRNLPSNFPRSVEEQVPDSIEQEELTDEPPDTVRIYTPYRLKAAVFFDDTLLHPLFHHYDAIRLQDLPYFHLGNNGSPHRPAGYILNKRQGLDFGLHSFDLYRKHYEDLIFLDSRRPFAIFRFAQKSFSQEDLQLESRFSKTFQNGLHLDLNYSSIQYKGEFTEQITKDRNGAFSLWYHSPKGNYDAIVSFLTNDIRNQDNGGVPFADSLLTISQYRRATETLDVLLDGRSRQRNNEFSVQNGFNLRWKNNILGAMHRIALRKETAFYEDFTSPNDSFYYGPFYVKDTQQLQLRASGLVNEFRVDGLLAGKNYLMGGLKHEYYSIDRGPVEFTRNLLYILGQYQQSLFGSLQLNAEGQWGLLENLGEYYLKGQIRASSRKLGSLEGHLILQRSPVPLAFSEMYNGKTLLFNNDFEKPLTNQIGGSMTIAALAFKAGIDQSILSNTIYLDGLRMPVQESSALSITSLYFDKAFDLGKLHSRHAFTYQISTAKEILRIPSWHTRHQVYYQASWFRKAMEVLTGFETRIIPGFRSTAYFPLMASFYNADRGPVAFHPYVEYFFNFQLRNFRGFFKIEGLEYLFYPAGKTFYETYDQPLFRTNMRLGFTWTLRD